MNVEDFLPEYPLYQDNKDFSDEFLSLKEFDDLKLSKNEDIPIVQGDLLNQQKFISRFISYLTPYKRVFLIHQVGTGKTCTSFAAAENIMRNPDSKPTLVITSSENAEPQFKDQLIDKCTTGFYIENNEEKRYRPSNYRSFNLLEWIEYQVENYLFLNAKQQEDLERVNFIRQLLKTDKQSVVYNKRYLQFTENIKTPEGIQKELTNLLKYNQISEEILSMWKTNPSLTRLYFENVNNISSVVDIKNKLWNERYKYIKDNISVLPKKNVWSTVAEKTTAKEKDDLKKKGKIAGKEYNTIAGVRKSALTRNVSKRYIFTSISKLLQRNDKNTEEKILQMARKYSNRLIIVDEAHKLLQKEVYAYAKLFFENLKNCKVIFMSATPIKNDIKEFGKLLEMLLGKEDKINFNDYIEQKDNVYNLTTNPKKLAKLSHKLGIYISYLKAQTSTTVFYAGEKYPDVPGYNLYPDVMEEHQSKSYLKVYSKNDKNEKDEDDDEKSDSKKRDKSKKDDKPRKQGISSPAEEAALFVFPDGSIGEAGFKKYISNKDAKDAKKLSTFIYKDTKGLSGKDKYNKMLDNLKVFSVIYANVIRKIVENPTENMFVYCDKIVGGGLRLFAYMLELFDIGKYHISKDPPDNELENIDKIPNNRKLYYTVMTSEELDKNVITTFNSIGNTYSKHIHVILGSSTISEMYSFYNIRQIHILQAEWNFAVIDQIVGRGVRFGSHNNLPVEKRNVTVYLHTAIPNLSNKEIDKSIDYYKYKRSQLKDYAIKKLEYLWKTSAIDCTIFKGRNEDTTNNNNSRDCEYEKCNYTCDIRPTQELKINPTNYQVYYSDAQVFKIKQLIINMFSINFKYEFKALFNECLVYNLISPTQKFLVLKALYTLIYNQSVIYNKYGFPCYLKQSNNVYFLSNEKVISENIKQLYYTQYPIVKKTIDSLEYVNFVHDVPFSIVYDEFKRKQMPKLGLKFYYVLTPDEKQSLKKIMVILKNSGIKLSDEFNELYDKIEPYILGTNDEIKIDADCYKPKPITRDLLESVVDLLSSWYKCGKAKKVDKMINNYEVTFTRDTKIIRIIGRQKRGKKSSICGITCGTSGEFTKKELPAVFEKMTGYTEKDGIKDLGDAIVFLKTIEKSSAKERMWNSNYKIVDNKLYYKDNPAPDEKIQSLVKKMMNSIPSLPSDYICEIIKNYYDLKGALILKLQEECNNANKGKNVPFSLNLLRKFYEKTDPAYKNMDIEEFFEHTKPTKEINKIAGAMYAHLKAKKIPNAENIIGKVKIPNVVSTLIKFKDAFEGFRVPVV